MTQQTDKLITSGHPRPLGASPACDGTNFAIYSKEAEEIYLLLFDSPGSEPSDIIRLECKSDFIRHVFVGGVSTGQLYGYKAVGPHDENTGLMFDLAKFLLDPYAKAVTGKPAAIPDSASGYPGSGPEKITTDKSMSAVDNSSMSIMPKCIVIDDRFDWEGDSPPGIAWADLIIYEVHVRGFTADPSSGVRSPGTFSGFVEKIDYLVNLGINAVELLPVFEKYSSPHLTHNGKIDYWGYNTICFFAPESSYSSTSYPGCQVDEFKTLVRELHKAGIEVILDVVYNHTAEGNAAGPCLCFRGIDNRSYYKLEKREHEESIRYVNDTGCGNTLDIEKEAVLRLVIDSLVYWVKEMHVDGFRFDLATILGRRNGKFDQESAFFMAIAGVPELKNIKLIAEPWDLTTYQVGHFPHPWVEMNGKYRDTIRRFLKNGGKESGEYFLRFAGSPDIYSPDRNTGPSVNFITCHDGFTLADLFAYNEKHNLANGESNRDGWDYNDSFNCGAEGETNDPAIMSLRNRMVRNGMTILLLSFGIPFVLGGDEFGRTQHGNNNAYCQDNRISYHDWSRISENEDLLIFFKMLINLRKRLLMFRKSRAGNARENLIGNYPSIEVNARTLNPFDFESNGENIFCFDIRFRNPAKKTFEERLYLCFNLSDTEHTVLIPALESGLSSGSAGDPDWECIIDTAGQKSKTKRRPDDHGCPGDRRSYRITAKSILVFELKPRNDRVSDCPD
jgi:isoamylase